MFRRIWSIVFSIVLIAFTVYVVMDSFVIERVYEIIPSSEETQNDRLEDSDKSEAGDRLEDSDKSEAGDRLEDSDKSEAGDRLEDSDKSEAGDRLEDSDKSEVNDSQNNSEPVVTDNSYKDSNIAITINEYRYSDTTVYVADIVLSSPEYLHRAFAKGAYGRNITEKTSAMAADAGAILAINGDYYGAQQRGYVITNGNAYRTTSNNKEDLVIGYDGTFSFINEGDISVDTILENGAKELLSFGPVLIRNGQIAVDENDEVGKAMENNPRTAIGYIDELHYVMIVADGRTSASQGLKLYELSQFMKELGVTQGYNLDGGGSSTMYFNGKVINNPTTNGRTIKERSVSDIVYIGY